MKVKLGVIGVGYIANKFVEGCEYVKNIEVVGAYSRTYENVKEFCDKWNIKRPYKTIFNLFNDSEIDAVYIATTNDSHYKYIKMALENNKHVYCEKPIVLNLKDLEELIKIAREKKLLLVEGMWTCFLPIIKEVKKLVLNNEIGDIQFLNSDFGFYSRFDKTNRLYMKSTGGGALYDVGIYVIAMSVFFINEFPNDLSVVSKIGPTGVDHKNIITLLYKSLKKSTLFCSIDYETSQKLVLTGSKGKITIPQFWRATSYTIELFEGSSKTIHLPFTGNGYDHIIEEFVEDIRNGKIESVTFSHDMSIKCMEIVEAVIRKI